MTWYETKGRIPQTGDKPLYLKFRNGEVSKRAYPAHKIRWTQKGEDWDVIAVSRGEDDGPGDASAWTPVSGGY